MVIDNMFKKLGLTACFVMASALVGCGDDPTPAACGAGEIAATENGATVCYKTCATSSECASTESCRATSDPSTKVCLPTSSNNNNTTDMGSDQGTDMGADQGMDQGTDMDMGSDQGVDMDMTTGDPDEALCMTYCDKLFGSCATSQCGAALTAATKAALDQQYDLCINGGTVDGQTAQACKDAVKASADNRTNVEQVANQVTCAQVKTGLFCAADGFNLGDECACPSIDPPSNLGAECSDGQTSTTCDAGSLTPFCTSDDPANPGECWAVGCSLGDNAQENSIFFGSATGCGDVNEGGCLALGDGQGGLIGACIETCQADADCAQAPTKGCNILGTLDDGTSVGVCDTKCASDADCVTQDANNNPVQGTCNAESFCDFQ